MTTAGGTVSMLKFSMTSFAGDLALSVSQGGHTLVTQTSSATFDGHVVLYTTALSGSLDGAQVSYTPADPPSSLPSSLTLTSFVAHQVSATADSVQMTGVRMTSG